MLFFFPMRTPLCEPVSAQALIALVFIHVAFKSLSICFIYFYFLFLPLFLFYRSHPLPPPRCYLLPWLQGSPGFGTPGPTPPPNPQRSGEHPPSQGHAHHHQVKDFIFIYLFFLPTMKWTYKKLQIWHKNKIYFSLSILCRNKETSRDEFIFYSKRLMRLLIERALSFLPSQVPNTPINEFIGVHEVCVCVMQTYIIQNKEIKHNNPARE